MNEGSEKGGIYAYLLSVIERFYISIAQKQLKKQVAINIRISSDTSKSKEDRKKAIENAAMSQTCILNLEIYKNSR